MSIQTVGWVLKQEIGDATAKYVLLALANYAGEDGENAFPSVARLQKDTELSERTIREKIGWLIEKGFIRLGNQEMATAYAKRKDRVTICYDFVLRGASSAPRKSTGCATPQNGVQDVPPRGAPAAPNPSVNHQLSGRAASAIGGAPPQAGSLRERLAAREMEPQGRQPDFASEFRKRFGSDPQ